MISPRQCALKIFHETVQNGGYPNLLYKQLANGYDDRDRKLITLLVSDVLSQLIHVDYVLSKFIAGKKVKPIIKNILRMAVDQIKFLDFPAHAVINESVQLCETIGKPMLKGFVNGVLRNYVRNININYPPSNSLEYYSIINSKPMWLMELWEKDYGFENAVIYSRIRNSGTAVRFKSGFDGESWLNEKGYTFNKAEITSNAYILDSSYDIFNTDEYKNGTVSVQGIGSMIACSALNPQSGDCVLDACSAPGGKTINLCERMGRGKIVACDLYQSRVELVKQNLDRCGFSFGECYVQDMSKPINKFVDFFDKVLVDAPCSGLGEINSKADIMLNKSLDDIFALSKLQFKILNNCADYVKSGGVLVYSTCTINKIENDGVVKNFLDKRRDFSLDKFVLDNDEIVESGMLQLTPDIYDGFFVARFIKK